MKVSLVDKETILKSLRFASVSFLRSADWEKNINKVLEHFGLSYKASRINIFQNHTDKKGIVYMSMKYEWTAKGIKPKIINPIFQNLPYEKFGYERLKNLLLNEKEYYGITRNLPDKEKELLKIHNVFSILIIPIFISFELWGFIGFDECLYEREWDSTEIDYLTILADIIGIALKQKNDNCLLIKNKKNLKIAKKKAEESERLKTAFLSNLSHEIRTPMNAIIGFSNLLSEPNITDNEKDKFIKHINNNGNELINIIDNIIDIAKLETGQVRILETEFKLNKELYDLYVTLNKNKKTEGKENINIILKKTNKDVNFTILTDPLRIKQIFANLLNNAVKFTNNGSIEFGYTFINAKTLLFYVKDTGIGIPGDKLEVVFDKFRQGDDSSTRKYSGTGLGLAISKNIINLLGGEIYVESELGRGTSFSFTLPYKPVKQITDAMPVNNMYKWNNKTILIAEDVESNFELIKTVLRKTKAKILWAKNGKEAVEECKTNDNINLILMDIRMPEMNGLIATSKIKQFRKNIPIIAQTAYAMVEDEIKSINAGCIAHISKPIKPKLLLSKINKYLA
ncbi:MAG: response regulator [Bacteroidales bacterium]|nr:response regulator [Bacteroidales bacterium]